MGRKPRYNVYDMYMTCINPYLKRYPLFSAIFALWGRTQEPKRAVGTSSFFRQKKNEKRKEKKKKSDQWGLGVQGKGATILIFWHGIFVCGRKCNTTWFSDFAQ